MIRDRIKKVKALQEFRVVIKYEKNPVTVKGSISIFYRKIGGEKSSIF